ncbi:hypothetical protein ONZ45_g10398 [Pleurotus djamor]|nr:hypothetical protein ONZ45_g10398 [Pleurotus djamor]
MLFKPTALFLVALTPMTSAVRLAGFSSTTACEGPSFFCNTTASVCCALPDGFGFSVQFLDLPSGTQGQGYTGSTCTSFLFAVFGPGDQCHVGEIRATHLNWFHSPAGPRGLPVRAETTNSTCGISGFTYKDATGVEKSIKVPLGEADNIVALYTKKDFAALAEYPEY